MSNIRLFPYISSPRGVEVCYTVNGGPILRRKFPAGTTKEQILAALDGHPIPPADTAKEQAAKDAAEKAKRAAESQPADTATEEDIQQQDAAKEDLIAELNMMRAALKEAKVKGYQLLKEAALRKKYAELQEKTAADDGKGE